MENKITLKLVEDKIRHILSKPKPKILISKQMKGGKYVLDNGNIILEENEIYNDIDRENTIKYDLKLMDSRITKDLNQNEIKYLYNIIVKYFDDLRISQEKKEEKERNLLIIDYLKARD